MQWLYDLKIALRMEKLIDMFMGINKSCFFLLLQLRIFPGTSSENKKYFEYSSPSVIKPLCLPRNCGHIREVAFGEREK